jgi:zinc protease
VGVAFGAHSNAHTSFDETVYKLEMPDGSAANLDLAMQIMAETAGGMLILPEEVERERGIILSEMRDRDGAGLRLARRLYAEAYRGFFLAERFPIGTPETVGAADAALLRGYWERFYRPDRLVVTVAGAVDAGIGAVIAKHFSGLDARRSGADPATGTIAAGTAAAVHDEPEADGLELHLVRAASRPDPADGADWRRTQLLRSLATRILNRRYAAAVEQDPSGPILGAGAQAGQRWNIHQVWLSAQVRAGSATAAVGRLILPLRSLLVHGPTRTELDLEVRAIRAELDTAVAQAGSRTSAGLAEGTARTLAFARVPTSPAQDRDLVAPWLAAATPEQVRTALVEAWDLGVRETLHLAGRDAGVVAVDRLAAAWAAATAAAIAPPVERAAVVWAYPDGAGRWVEGTEPLPGIWSGRLANGVAAAIRPSASQPGSVTVQVRLHHGPEGRVPGLGEWFSRGFAGGGLGRHTAQDLRELLAATSVRGPSVSLAEDGTVLQVGCRAADITTACRVLAAYLADPGWREDAAIPARAGWIDELAAAAQDLDAAMERTVAVRTTGDDPRRRPATIDEVRALAWADVRAAWAPILARSPVSVLVVGDVEAEPARSAIAAAFGALAERPAPAVNDLADRRWLAEPRPWQPGTHRFAVTAQKPSAQVRMLWPTADIYDITRFRRLGLLAACLDERMRVRLREELGLGYSPGAGRWSSDAWAGAGYVVAMVGPPTERVDEAVRELQALAADLANRIDADLLAQVRTPTLRSLAATRARNDWWLNTVMARAHRQPFRYAWSTTLDADIAGATVDDLRALAREILVPERAMIVVGTAAP